MYDGDSFFTLSVAGQIGLTVLSGILALAMCFVTWHLTRTRSPLARLFIAILLFGVFEWLSPQIYYTYYRAIIPDLPLQWVIATWPDPSATLRLLTFSEEASLSAHGRGLLGWAMLLIALIAPPGAYSRQDKDS